MKIAVFPGSFDPITRGHEDIVRRALPLFDKVIMAVGINSKKRSLYSIEERMDWIRAVFHGEEKIEVKQFSGLTVHFCEKVGAKYIIRGLRNGSDFDYEKTISQLNADLGNIESIFFISKPQFSHISSTIVREIILGKGDASLFLPDSIKLK